jgi:tetratricopeptide (TPR) repeat protein
MMPNHMRLPLVAVVVGLALAGSTQTLARESSGNPAAKARLAEGEAAAKAGKLAEAAAAFRKAIDADPDYVDAHQRFIDITHRLDNPGSRTSATPRLQQQYERWARQYPKHAVYQWALGVIADDPDAGDAHFQKALAIDPAFAPAHFQLAKNADLRGDFAAQREHLKTASDLNPQEPRYLIRYALAWQKADPQRFRAMALDVVAKFPASQQAAEALYHLADRSVNPERRAYFDRLRADYPFDRYGYSASAMYDLYAEVTTPEEALSVAQEMAKAFPAQKGWAQRVAIQDAMTRAKALVAGGRFADALETLDKTQRPSGNHGITWTLLKADAAAGAGHPDQAYAALLDMAATVPNERLDGALAKLGSALGRTGAEVDAEVWRARDAKAKPAPAFELPSSRGGAPVRLADYRGKLVLLAFWFPG